MVEHSPWIGENYGKNGYPVMLWGFSHHQPNDADDYIEMTRRTIEEEALTDRHWFFQRIKNIFGEKGALMVVMIVMVVVSMGIDFMSRSNF